MATALAPQGVHKPRSRQSLKGSIHTLNGEITLQQRKNFFSNNRLMHKVRMFGGAFNFYCIHLHADVTEGMWAKTTEKQVLEFLTTAVRIHMENVS